MQKTVTVHYTPFGEQKPVAIPLRYAIEDSEEIQTLLFQVDMPLNTVPWWLKPHKFEVRARYNGNSYEVLMNETRNVHSVDAALFMDKAQEEVCFIEKRMPIPAKRRRP